MKKSLLRGATIGLIAVLVPTTAHAATVATWKMDEAKGATTMVDSAGAGGANNGTITGVRTGVRGLVSGKAYQFGGSTSHVVVPHHDALNPGTSDVTLTATVKIPNHWMADDSYDVIRKGETTTASGYYKMEIKRHSSNKPTIGYLKCVFKVLRSDGTLATYSRTAWIDLVDGRKHAIACVKTGTSVRAVVGKKVSKGAAAAGAIANSEPVYVGTKYAGDDVMQGVVDEVAVAIG